AIYILTWTWKGWLPENVRKHFKLLMPDQKDPPDFYYEWRGLIVSLLAFTILWLVFFWMYRRKIFIRI
ncbi:MAG: hypothetical protein N2C12_03105, partial [Planctomycetales bacterium]